MKTFTHNGKTYDIDVTAHKIAGRYKDMTVGEVKELGKWEKFKWEAVSFYDALHGAKKIIDSRTPLWERIIKRLLSFIEAATKVVAMFSSKGILSKIGDLL